MLLPHRQHAELYGNSLTSHCCETCICVISCMCAGPSRLVGHHVLAYVCEDAYVTRSKTPVVDALLVLYPAFAAMLTPSSSKGLLRARAL